LTLEECKSYQEFRAEEKEKRDPKPPTVKKLGTGQKPRAGAKKNQTRTDEVVRRKKSTRGKINHSTTEKGTEKGSWRGHAAITKKGVGDLQTPKRLGGA